MANQVSVIDEWSVKDLEDGSSLRVHVLECSELGNASVPGLQVHAMGIIINYEPNIVEQWAYKAGKKGESEYFLEDKSWTVHEDQYIRNYLVTGNPLKAKIVVKTRSSAPVSREYNLPFEI
ncbi:MAG: hypothetical protein EOO04_21480 [Chitinophagaceae bacterium]|nr:MAG: hypothetical protein EOO04_21480 [Chitinophagaceae bacterium]